MTAPILTTAEVRAFGVGTNLDDGSLAIVLDSTAAEIERVAGVAAATTERIAGGASRVMLAHEAAAVTTVIERSGTTVTTLASDDYELEPSRISVRRLTTGTNRRGSCWADEVDVTYATNDSAQRKTAQLALVKLELDRNPGLASETIGAWSRSFAAAGQTDLERDAILASLRSDHLMFFS